MPIKNQSQRQLLRILLPTDIVLKLLFYKPNPFKNISNVIYTPFLYLQNKFCMYMFNKRKPCLEQDTNKEVLPLEFRQHYSDQLCHQVPLLASSGTFLSRALEGNNEKERKSEIKDTMQMLTSKTGKLITDSSHLESYHSGSHRQE